jgi:hypothetical protein
MHSRSLMMSTRLGFSGSVTLRDCLCILVSVFAFASTSIWWLCFECVVSSLLHLLWHAVCWPSLSLSLPLCLCHLSDIFRNMGGNSSPRLFFQSTIHTWGVLTMTTISARVEHLLLSSFYFYLHWSRVCLVSALGPGRLRELLFGFDSLCPLTRVSIRVLYLVLSSLVSPFWIV